MSMAKLGRKVSRECGMLSFRGFFPVVIPGRATWREPGIHNHGIVFGARWGASHDQIRQSWLWIPGPRFRASRNDNGGIPRCAIAHLRLGPRGAPRNDEVGPSGAPPE